MPSKVDSSNCFPISKSSAQEEHSDAPTKNRAPNNNVCIFFRFICTLYLVCNYFTGGSSTFTHVGVPEAVMSFPFPV